MNRKVKRGRSDRRIVNFLLQPLLQLRIGFYSVGIGVLFCLLMGGYLYFRLSEFADVVVTLTEADGAIFDLIQGYLADMAWVTLGGGLLFTFLNLCASIYFTHKMVGPTVAFRRQIKSMREGDFDARVHLRRGDAFTEVADELNALSEDLSKGLGSQLHEDGHNMVASESAGRLER